jgi:protein TonB
MWLAAAMPAQARDPLIGRILPPGEAPAADSAVLRLAVGPNGRATGCTIERSSGSAETDANTCRYFTRRGEWRSQRDAQGHRVAYEMVMEVFRVFLDRVAEFAR